MSTTMLDRTVAELVLERPARSRFFESIGIDYCCGGKKTLREACDRKSLPSDQVLELLAALCTELNQDQEPDAGAMTLGDLIDHILEAHHQYLRQELPRLGAMLRKVERVHGDRNEQLATMLSVFEAFTLELNQHMMKEEEILFPAIARMEAEHDDAGNALEQLRALSDGYTPPEWACNTYRALLDGLHDLERNMHAHVHKETNILFPKAIRLEEQLKGETE
ncbi:MAG: iron-sulfur cluster repair di-iron protein [Candidatus Hydrogenedentes bacterium]|nr:iron-sulfur cluster repair di-iron protein [Candidatus Hydrogenedentota bacterium]